MHKCSDTAGERGRTMPRLSACGGNWTRMGCKEQLLKGLRARKDLVFSCVLNKVVSE